MSPAETMTDPALSPEQAEREAKFFALLSSETRLRILALLGEQGPTVVGEIAEGVGISTSAVSQHLNHLRLGGLVERARKAQHQLYSLSATGREVRLRQAPEKAGVLFR
jgi:DNA-binding transcriptional ArsR family regulator